MCFKGSGCRKFERFTKPFLAKLAKFMFQNHLIFTEPTIAVIFKHTEIWYDRTQAHTQTFYKGLQETLSDYLHRQFAFSVLFFQSTKLVPPTQTINHTINFNYRFYGQKSQRTKIKNEFGRLLKSYLLP